MRVPALVTGDLANLRRDPMLTAAALAPVLVAILLRLGLGPATEALEGVVDLVPAFPTILGAAMLLAPYLAGFVFGFILVEEKEERILDAVAITARGTRWFFGYRVLMPAVMGGAGALVVALASGVVPVGIPRTILAAVLGAASAGTTTLVLVVTARDRVQALAVAKLTSFFLAAAVAFQFMPDPWRWALAPIPTVWVVEAVSASGPVWWSLIGGTATHLAVAGLFWRQLGR